MCGIVGYVGNREVTSILMDGLKKLEYRGYDSSGIGIISAKNGAISVRKTQGKINNLVELIKANGLPTSHVGISHTRWATHGKPNKINAHPHFDCTGKILVVHNGIIENYEDLRDKLKAKGHTFLSETDTEVIAHLIEEHHKGDLLAAIRMSIKQLKGSFALGIINSDHPDCLMAARVGSPLIIGVGKNENYIASDVPAILDRTKKIIYLQDGQMALLEKDKVQITTFSGKAVKPKINTVRFKIGSAQKEGFPHFMLKEIHEQPKVLEHMLAHRLKSGKIFFDGLALSEKELKAVKKSRLSPAEPPIMPGW